MLNEFCNPFILSELCLEACDGINDSALESCF